MPTFNLSIVSPQGRVFEGPAESLIAPGTHGELGILAHHAPMITVVNLGKSAVTANGVTQLFVTGKGILEVERDGVNLLVDHAEKVDSAEKAREVIAAEAARRKG